MRTRLCLLIAVVVLLFVTVWMTRAVGEETEPKTQNWEYKLVELNDPEMPQRDYPELTALGARGWELVTVLQERHGVQYLAFMKRPR